MTSETELNEKLLVFVGWIKYTKTMWRIPSEYMDAGNLAKPPDFVHDIKACIEILGPKLDSITITISLNVYNRKAVSVFIRLKDKVISLVEGEYPVALAFCRAVEQAIDKGSK